MSKIKKVAVAAEEKATEAPIKIKKNKTVVKSVKKIKDEPAKSKKDLLREEIADTLQKSFTEIKKLVGEKKFNKHVKKASKVLAGGATNKVKEDKTKKNEPSD